MFGLNKSLNNKISLKISFVYISSILGAGFATGHELVNFFAKYGITAIVTYLFSCLLIGLFITSLLSNISVHKGGLNIYLEEVFGKSFGRLINYINIAFMFVLFAGMLSGGGNVLANIISGKSNISRDIIILEHKEMVLMGVVIGICMLKLKGDILELNNILCPVILIGSIGIGYINIRGGNYGGRIGEDIGGAVVSSIVYSSYNLISTIGIVYSLKENGRYELNEKIIRETGVISGGLIFIGGIFLVIGLVGNIERVRGVELPILEILEGKKGLKVIYEGILLTAIFTTAISNGFALTEVLGRKIKGSRESIIIITVVSGVIFGMIGFGNIVDVVYPLFGYMGIFEVAVIVGSYVFGERRED